MSDHHFFLNTPSSSRKLLHHPFFPLTSSQSPSQSPSTNFPKLPFSTNQNPFFPSNPTPNPPPYHSSLSSSSSLPTFPANISSLITPSSHPANARLIKAIIFPIFSLLVLSLFLLFLFFRRKKKRLENGHDCSDNDRLFPPNTASSDGRKAAEFLYLGTLVSSRGEGGSCSAGQPASSPELRPLPPLVRRSSSEEDFQSPCGSPEDKRLNFYVPTLSSPSYPSSNVASSSSSPVKLPNLAVFRPPPASISSPRRELSSSSSSPQLKKAEAFERGNFVVLPPPPPPPASVRRVNGFDGVERRGEIVRPKLKPLHWDKVKASSDRAMVWDQMKSSSFQ